MSANTIASDAVVSRVLSEYQNPKIRTSEIAERYGVSAAAITLWARKAGIPMRTRGRKAYDSPTERQSAIIRTAMTVSTKEAVTRFGVKKQHVSRLVRRWKGWNGEAPAFKRGDILVRGSERVTVLRAFVDYGVVLKADKTVSKSWSWSRKGVTATKIGVDEKFAASADAV